MHSPCSLLCDPRHEPPSCGVSVVFFIFRVDYERIKAVGPDRAAAEWLLRCGAKVRFQGFDRWQHDYNGLPTGVLGKYKIQAIDATESCIMFRGFDHLGECQCVEGSPPLVYISLRLVIDLRRHFQI